ncbi:hypothetical protein [uncultured Chryseobacterium sp.]|uniref:hypothetical protein n=1 Tax=uncultured Chryseobacterium sp. TaxID=259322 RepID=UPI0025CC9FD8|nr:hypothetical protein [uncultured Chryseobacterium sp.]
MKGIASYHRYDISVANKPFLVSMSVWATNMNLKKIGFLILPNIHNGLKFHTEDDFFSDAKIIIEKVSQKMDDKLTKNQLCELLVNLQ